MKSTRGLLAACVLLLAFPFAALYRAVFDRGVEVVIHLALAAGTLLVCASVFDFRTARWIAWIACLSTGLLGTIFLVQAAAELLHNALLTRIAYQVLGQGLERWLFDVFALWCIAVLLADSHGRTRIGGGIALGLVVCVELIVIGLSMAGSSLNAVAPQLFVLYFLPFVWLLFESRTTRPPLTAA
jgi:hypothetical protein